MDDCQPITCEPVAAQPITCRLTFRSAKPLSVTKPLTFHDSLGNRCLILLLGLLLLVKILLCCCGTWSFDVHGGPKSDTPFVSELLRLLGAFYLQFLLTKFPLNNVIISWRFSLVGNVFDHITEVN